MILISSALQKGDFHTALPLIQGKASDLLSQLTLPDQWTPLHYACQHGRIDVAQQLITNFQYSIENQDSKGHTPLHIAAVYGQLEVVRYLLTVIFESKISGLGLKVDSDAETINLIYQHEISNTHSDLCGNTPLHTASTHGQLDIVQLLTGEIGCDPNHTNSEGLSCLHMATQHGHLSLVKYLLDEAGCNMTLEDEHGRTPSYLAAGMGYLDILKYLIEEKGADPHFKTTDFIMAAGKSLLHTASREGHLEMVTYLVEHHGCDPSCQDENGITPLHYASRNGCLNVVQYLVDTHRCDPLHPDSRKLTPLHLAAVTGQLAVIKYFTVTHHCDPQLRSAQNVIPLHFAAIYGHLDVVKFLIEELNCNPNSTDSSGQTPLHDASINGHLDIVIYLVDRCRCDPMVVDVHGQTPQELARLAGHPQVNYYLSVITDTLPSSPMPSDMWSPPGHSHSYLYMWCLKYANSSQFFASLLIEHLRKIYLASKDVYCTTWKNGILFAYENGTKAMIDVSEQTSRVYLVMQCVKGSELDLVEKRSLLISKIKSLTRKICLEIRIMECLFQPQKRYPPEITQEIPCSEVAHSIKSNSQHILVSSTQHILLSDLLHFDSLQVLGGSLFEEIFRNRESELSVPAETLHAVCKAVSINKTLQDSLQRKARNSQLTFKCLFIELHKYTIFPGGDLYVSRK